jgi:hypothetical protein
MRPTGTIPMALLLCLLGLLPGCTSAADLRSRIVPRQAPQDPRLPAEPSLLAAEPRQETTAPIPLEDAPRRRLLQRRTETRTARERSAGRVPARDAAAADTVETPAARQARWKAVPPGHKPTPAVNSPEWQREQEEADRKDRALDREIRSICRRC